MSWSTLASLEQWELSRCFGDDALLTPRSEREDLFFPELMYGGGRGSLREDSVVILWMLAAAVETENMLTCDGISN